ncbi:radical SAM protein [bacterium]|nr:radical SAM protein [bacterium]
MNDSLNKKIYSNFNIVVDQIWLSLTDRCNLACEYCCVNKKNEDLGLEEGKSAVNLLFRKGKKRKYLIFSGGEPMLCFGILKRIVRYANREARKRKTEIKYTIVTNGTIANKEITDFLIKFNFKVIISFSGQRESHDAFRYDRKGKGSYDLIINNFKYFKKIKSDNLIISFMIHPQRVKQMFEDFKFICEIGFNNLYLCSVSGVEWNSGAYNDLKESYVKIQKHVVNNIKKNKFIYVLFPTRLINQLYVKSSEYYSCDGSANCPLEFRLRVLPNGNISLNLFSLNELVVDDFMLGTIKEGFLEAYLGCEFDPNSSKCGLCIKNLERKDKRYEYDFLKMKEISLENAKIGKEANLLLCDSELNFSFAEHLFRESKKDKRFNKYVKGCESVLWGA